MSLGNNSKSMSKKLRNLVKGIFSAIPNPLPIGYFEKSSSGFFGSLRIDDMAKIKSGYMSVT